MNQSEISSVRSDLVNSISGSVLDSGDLGYAESVSIDNGRISLQPHLIVMPSNAKDVATVVRYCHKHGVPLTMKAGGHSAAGYCLNEEGIVLDLVNLDTLDFIDKSESSVKVGAGVRWIRVYNFLRDRQSKYTVIGGGCAGVGVAGFILGGGYSFISRSYGLGSDNVVGMQFVTATGQILELSQKSTDAEAELYWALRGGGGGNFGVVTRIDLKLQETPTPRQTMGQIDFPFYRIEEVLNVYNNWVHTSDVPSSMAIYGMLRRFPDRRFGGQPMLTLRFTPIFNGEMDEAEDILRPLTELVPNSKELYTMSLPEWENFVGTSTQVKGRSAYIRSSVLPPKSLTNKVADVCKEHMARAPSNDTFVVWTHTGGQIRANGKAKTSLGSYAHRDAEFTFEVKSQWDSNQRQLARPNIEWAVKFFDDLAPHAQGAYLNYMDPLQLDWKKSYYRDNYERLLKIRHHWDRDGMFSFQQGIGSDYETPARPNPPNRPDGTPINLDLSPLFRTISTVKKKDA